MNQGVVEKIINILLDILIVVFSLVLLVSIYTGIQTKVLKHEYADFFGYSLFEVQTGSMADTINAGDWILVQLTKNIKLNDIITFKKDDNFITHRVIGIYNKTYVTMGDANTAKDDPITEDQIVGKVTHTFAKFGILRKTLFNPIILLTLIATLFICNIIFKKNQLLIIKSKWDSLFGKKKAKDKKIINNAEVDLNTYQKTCDYDNYKETEKTQSVENPKEVHVVTVNNSDLENGTYNPLSEVTVDKEELTKAIDQIDDTEKTSLYRVIPVDSSEIEETFLEIAENEMNNKQLEVKKEVVETQEEEEPSFNVDLELLKNSKLNRKSKNIVDKFINVKLEKIEELLHIFDVDDEKLKVNEGPLREMFTNTYLNVRYYNYYEAIEYKYRSSNMSNRVVRVLKVIAKELKNNYKGSDSFYNDKVDKYLNLFTLISVLEHGNDIIEDLKVKKEFYENEILESLDCFDNKKITKIVDKVLKIQNDYDGAIEYFLKKLETNMFDLKGTRIGNKELYALNLEHSLDFSKVYSDYIIEKTYNEGIVAEDKVEVAITLALSQIIKDMQSGSFNRKYLLYLPSSLYSKDKKIIKILKMFDDEYAKKSLNILVTYSDFINNIVDIKKMSKSGYHVAVVINKESNFYKKDLGNLELCDYIFIIKNADYREKVMSLLSSDLTDKVIYDNIVDKIGDLGSE